MVYMLVQERNLYPEKQQLCQILCRIQLACGSQPKSGNGQGKTRSTLISSVSASVTITASMGLLPQPLTLSCGCKAGNKDGMFLQSHKVNSLTGTFRLHVRYKNYTVCLKYLRACVYIVCFYIFIFLFVIFIHKRMFFLKEPRR